MDSKQHQELIRLIDDLKTDATRRAAFLQEPVKTLAPVIGTSGATSADLSLSNQVLLAIMRNPQLMDELRDFSAQHDSGQIDDVKLAQLTAGSLSQHLSDDLKKQIHHPGLEAPGLGPVALANLIAHVDIVVVITEAAVVNSRVVFSGITDPSMVKLKDIANMLAKGQ